MTDLGTFQVLIFGASAFGAALAALVLMAQVTRRRAMSRKTLDTDGDPLVFLVRGDRLIDANFAAHQFLEAYSQCGKGLSALRRGLHANFDNADELLAVSVDGARAYRTSRDGTAEAASETLGGTVRLTIKSSLQDTLGADSAHRLAALETELATLRETADSAPCLMWRESPDGTPIWVNRAYLETVRDVFGTARAAHWPLPKLFNEKDLKHPKRTSLTIEGEDRPRWFECTSVQIGEDRLFMAFDAGATVRAESQLKEFMQTLAKTFAELTVGLAIFDRQRNLRLFNPALVELTTLPTDFLSGCPTLIDFLDRLRECRIMPEPRDYKEWRRQIAELEAAAESGSYSETWSLPGNLTYRITGRPHADGAIAFLFEDISAEISLTRQFRRELEVSQTLLDNMEDATAHFSRDGTLVQTNRAYRALWSQAPDGEKPDRVLGDVDVVKASRVWHSVSEPTPVWGDARDFVLDSGERAEWEAKVRLRDGHDLHCRFIPTTGGGSQVIFRLVDETQPKRTRILELVR